MADASSRQPGTWHDRGTIASKTAADSGWSFLCEVREGRDKAWKSLRGDYTFSYIRRLCDARLRTMVVGPPAMRQRHAASSILYKHFCPLRGWTCDFDGQDVMQFLLLPTASPWIFGAPSFFCSHSAMTGN